ncbi:MAG: hypothetical protein H6560_13505, partial [Lewinellaceae bacterium]|nr:hypothetical protein [Lewinellaceae bacterium]
WDCDDCARFFSFIIPYLGEEHPPKLGLPLRAEAFFGSQSFTRRLYAKAGTFQKPNYAEASADEGRGASGDGGLGS